MPGRRILVRKYDVLLIGEFEIDVQTLMAVLNPAARVLWSFMNTGERVQPVAYTEEQVIWMDREKADAT